MFSICLSIRHTVILDRWKGGQPRGTILPLVRMVRVANWQIPCSVNGNSDPSSYDPSNLLELQVDPPLRVDAPDSGKERSWFGPNGQYIRELPCPSCRGRGYIPCPECGVERSRVDCSQCNGKGIKTCLQCLGECVIWEESYDERPWEKARSSCPIKVKEDDEIDGLEIKVKETKKSKRVYGRPSPEVIQKISRSLKSLNAKTGLFSKRMKMIHKDPVLRAQRIAAIKKARGSPASRKQTSEMLKAYFSNPENRLKRSMAMKGVKFYCSKCGGEGHRSHYCPTSKTSGKMGFSCSVCRKKGHNRRTCRSRGSSEKSKRRSGLRRCKLCGQGGHYRTTCPQPAKLEGGNLRTEERLHGRDKRSYSCKVCLEKGHNSRTCPYKKDDGETSS